MFQVSITLPVNITEQQLHVLLKYFEKAGRLSALEWKIALNSFDMLSQTEL